MNPTMVVVTASMLLPGLVANKLTLTSVSGTKCLDGSQAGFYYGPPSSGTSSTWVVMLQGGGACMGGDCRVHYRIMGSSKNHSLRNGGVGYEKLPVNWTQPEFDADGFGPWPSEHTNFVNDHDRKLPYYGDANNKPPVILSNDKATNPLFHDAHHVWIPYCSADLWSGQFNDQHPMYAAIRDSQCKTPQCYMQGHTNLGLIVDVITAKVEFSGKPNVLFGGVSAGGWGGSLAHCDWMAGKVAAAKAGASTKCYVVAGMFLPMMSSSTFNDTSAEYYHMPAHWLAFGQGARVGAGAPDMVDGLDKLVGGFNVWVNPKCKASLAAKGIKKTNICMNAGTMLPSISTPIFIEQNLFDQNALIQPAIGFDQFAWGLAAQDKLVIDGVKKYLDYFGSAMRRTVEQSVKPTDGYFLAACLNHVSGSGAGGSGAPTAAADQGPFTSPKAIKICGTSGYEAMGAWFKGTSSANKFTDKCLGKLGTQQLPCNPTCWSGNAFVNDKCPATSTLPPVASNAPASFMPSKFLALMVAVVGRVF